MWPPSLFLFKERTVQPMTTGARSAASMLCRQERLSLAPRARVDADWTSSSSWRCGSPKRWAPLACRVFESPLSAHLQGVFAMKPGR
jgi:hypothetical protein